MEEQSKRELRKCAFCGRTERDHFMTADQACEYGLVDKVITKKEL